MEEDKKLYDEFLNGNKSAFNTLISKYKNNIIYFISQYVKDIDISEDIYQEISLCIWLNKKKYNPKYSFKTYLYTIAKSQTLNYMDKNKFPNLNLEQIENTVWQSELLEEIILSNERKIKIQKVIDQLKPIYKIVIYLTQIEGLTYKEVAIIMHKTEKQIKNLTYNAKKSLRKLLLKDELIEMKHNKFIRLLSWTIIIGIISIGSVFAVQIIKNKFSNAKLSPSFSGSFGNVKENKVWVGTFQIAWNEFIENLGGPIEFEEGNSDFANDLNKQSFTKDMLNEDSYYIGQGIISPKLHKKIKSDLKDKFNFNSDVLNKIDWTPSEESYLIYAMLRKSFTFETPFVELKSDVFGSSQNNVKYFGLNETAIRETFKQVTPLFYNSNKDFAVKIDTLEGEEVLLYRTNTVTNFQDTYIEMNQKAKSFKGRKTMLYGDDELKIPFLKVNAVINYDDLCNKTIKNTNGCKLQTAIQSVDFSLNNYGGNLISEAAIEMYLSTSLKEPRYFNFTDTFVLYLKEKNKDIPYFALLVDNTDILIVE